MVDWDILYIYIGPGRTIQYGVMVNATTLKTIGAGLRAPVEE